MPRRPLLAIALVGSAFAASCGEDSIEVAQSSPDYEGAKIFQERCSGCHTLAAAGTQGSATNPNDREIKDGPNFNNRIEDPDQVLFAIQNGGFSSGPMPQDIVVGEDARKVADFVAKYSGRDVASSESP